MKNGSQSVMKSTIALESRPSKERLKNYLYVKKYIFDCKNDCVRPLYKSLVLCPVFKTLVT